MSLAIAWAPRESVESKHTKVWHNSYARSENILTDAYRLAIWRTNYCPPAAKNTYFPGQQWAADLGNRTHMTEKENTDAKKERICSGGQQYNTRERQHHAAASLASRYTAPPDMKQDRPGIFSKATYFFPAHQAESHANGTTNFKVLQRYFLEDRCRISGEFLLEFAISAESVASVPAASQQRLAFASTARPVASCRSVCARLPSEPLKFLVRK